MSHMLMSHVTHMHESRHTWMSHVTHMTWMSHVTHMIWIYTYIYVHIYTGLLNRSLFIYVGLFCRPLFTDAGLFYFINMMWRIRTGWRRLIGSPKLQIIFHQRATKYRALLRKMTYKDKGSYESSPPCIYDSRCDIYMTLDVYIWFSIWYIRFSIW